MVEHAAQVEVIEQLGMLGHFCGVMPGDKFKCIDEFTSSKDLHFSLDLTDHILELIEN